MVDKKNKSVKKLFGKVVSTKMDKTAVVEVKRTFIHPHVEKVIRTSKKYKVHDESNSLREGNMVEIVEGRPASKTKYMYLLKVLDPGISK